MGERFTDQAIYDIIADYAEKLAPHDLRHTFAKLAHKGGSQIDQIQLSLGHDSIQTTEKHLGVESESSSPPLSSDSSPESASDDSYDSSPVSSSDSFSA